MILKKAICAAVCASALTCALATPMQAAHQVYNDRSNIGYCQLEASYDPTTAHKEAFASITPYAEQLDKKLPVSLVWGRIGITDTDIGDIVLTKIDSDTNADTAAGMYGTTVNAYFYCARRDGSGVFSKTLQVTAD